MLQLDFRKYCLLIVSLVFVFFDAQAQSGAWTKKADLPKGGGSACVVNDKIYVLGGTTAGSYSDLAYNVVYDPSTNTWEEKAPVPTPRGFLSTAVVNGIIYAIGGGYPTSKKTVEAYDPVTNTWTPKADMLGNRLGAQAVVVNGIIYNIGGNYTSRNCEAYDPTTNTWTKKADMPEGGGVVSVTVYNGLIYVFGGGYYSSFSMVYAYNPQTDTWTKKKNIPTPRFAFQTYLVNGKIYAMGGAQSEGSTSLATVEVYDPVSDTWETKANMPNNLAWFAGVVVNNKIYVIGGTSNWGVTMSRSVWEYDPAFHTDIAAGNVSGTWTLANSPYYINGEITIPNGETLTIEPGVEVVFMGHYKFNVQGRLIAIGTAQDTIRFTAENTGTGWHGVRFTDTPNTNDTSKIVYCSFKYGKANTGGSTSYDRCGGAVFIRGFDKVFVSNSLFENNMTAGDVGTTGGPGVCIFDASPTITKSTFINNNGNAGSAGAIKVDFSSLAVISGNIISNTVATVAAGGILIYSSVKPRIENNIIIHNQAPIGGGIYCLTNANPVLINNTIAYNSATSGGGIYFESNSDGIFINNILYGNTATSSGNQVFINDAGSDPVFKYCDVQGGKDGFQGAGAGANYTELYENNIDFNPLFFNVTMDDYRLSNSSPCIGAGIDSTEISGVWYKAPLFCKMEVPRPFPAGTNPDIGACENLLASPLVGVSQELNSPIEFILYQNYPNPFNPTTSIEYRVVSTEYVTLKIYDVLGNEVATLVNEEKPAGSYEVEFDGSNLSSGIYFYKFKAGNYLETKKMILVK
jgi:parallel beta-helix repeat protein